MPPTRIAILFLAMLVPMAALSHSGVQNPGVSARMHGMSTLAAQAKTLGDMAKGKTGFDAATARAAALVLSQEAARIPALFEAPHADPKSEALPAIWQDFDRFTAIASQLEQAASDAATNLSTPEDLSAAMRAIGATCAACHQAYRR